MLQLSDKSKACIMWCISLLLLGLLRACFGAKDAIDRPHIVLIVADDLGWNDVGFHGMNHIPTPNLDALAASGVTLNQHYVTPLCTPSRAALITGKYPIHTGMQHGVIYGMEPRGLPLTEKLLPQYLKELGYKTHLVGKWHLGSFSKDYLPLNRGFDSHLGFWTGKIDMYDHTNMEKGSWGYDFRRGFTTAYDLFGRYATDVYTEEAVKVVRTHNASSPLFLMVAHSAVHSGNPNEPIRAPASLIDSFQHINDTNRRRFAGVLSKLDESVGLVVEALQKEGLLQNSVILFTTDNGGPPAGFNDNAASNYPLRGTKNTLWEGGVRGAAFLWSQKLQHSQRVSKQRMHLVDWLPTLYEAAGGNLSVLAANKIDGLSLWQALSTASASPRASLPTLLSMDENNAALLAGDWKLIQGTNYNGVWDGWYGPSGYEGQYSAELTRDSRAGRALAAIRALPTNEIIIQLRSEAKVYCNSSLPEIKCLPLRAACLFNIAEDPCERRNLAEQNPDKLQELLSLVGDFNRSAVPPNNKPLDPAGDPARWGRVYTNFRDYNFDVSTHCL